MAPLKNRTSFERAAIGFRVKTGRATAVIVTGSRDNPIVLKRRPVSLADPDVPDSFQPYHAALDLPEREGKKVVERAVKVVRALGIRAVRDLITEMTQESYVACGVGLVVGSDIDPSKLGNAHIRAHALEGRLFREVLEQGAAKLNLPCLVVVEREAYEEGSELLGQPAERLKRVISELGKSVGRPWGSEEKMATLAAWLALAK
jgi:hypothetical protein